MKILEAEMTIPNKSILSDTDTLNTVFEKGCELYKHNHAFYCDEQSLTYASLAKSARDFAAYLQHFTPLVPGDRIALQLPNCLAYPVLSWGALLAGLTVVNVNPLYTKNELLHIYKDSGAKVLVLLGASFEMVSSLLEDSEIVNVCYLGGALSHNDDLKVSVDDYLTALDKGSKCDFDAVATSPTDIALLQYTGGTTGVAKGAVLTHSNLLSAADGFWQTTDIFTPGNEVFVAPLPLYHVYAFVAHIVVGVMFGVTSILIPNPRDIDAFCRALACKRFSLFVGINPLFAALCENEQFNKLDFSGLKFTLSGGMALNQSIAHRWQEVTQCPINEGYGLTETSAGVIINRGESCRRLGSVGKPMVGVAIKIVDSDGNECKRGERGELLIKGRQVMQGYWLQPEATRTVLKNEWLATGDIATLDEDGFVYIVDRIKDLIIVSGFNVYPAEIELVVNRLPEVSECAAIGKTSLTSGETVQLFVVLGKNKITTKAILDYCRDNLAAYKVPKDVVLIEELPKSPVGKILKRKLKPV